MTVLNRYVVHAVVLLVAIALSGYSTIDRLIPTTANMRLGAINAEGLTFAEGGNVGDVSLGRIGTIIKPVEIPSQAAVSHDPFTYTVADGDDLGSISRHFGLTMDDVRWSNTALTNTDRVVPGERLTLAPVDGVVVTVKPGDTAASIAAAYHVDVSVVNDFNYLRDPDHLVAGSTLIVPGGVGPVLFPRRASDQAPHMGPYPNGKFAYGYCTWYVASRRPVPWTGDAWMWFGNAKAMGYQTGNVPQPGAIMVTWESWVGHVAYVEEVYKDGSYTVSEMNYQHWNVIDERTIKPGDVPLIGFIY
jgi:LysM repeat protein